MIFDLYIHIRFNFEQDKPKWNETKRRKQIKKRTNFDKIQI